MESRHAAGALDDNGYKIYEYMCQAKANQDYMQITLGGGRLHDKNAAAGRK